MTMFGRWAELAAAMSHFGVMLSANAVANVMVALDLDTAKSVPLDELARTIDAFYRERRSFASATLDAVLRALEEKQLTGPGVLGRLKILRIFHSKSVVYGAGPLTAKHGGFWPGQFSGSSRI